MRYVKTLYIFSLLLLSVMPTQAAEYTFENQKIIDIAEPLTIDLNMFKGKVTVIGNQTDNVIIEAVKIVRASNRDEAEEVADHIEIKVTPKGNHIEIATNYLRMINRSESFWNKFLGTSGAEAYGAVEYFISVPTQTSISITGMETEIEVSSLEGDIEIKNSSGTFHAEYIYGAVTVSQPIGNIALDWIEGDIRVKSNSSKIRIKQVKGAIDLATYSGEVHIETELDSPKDYYIETTSGKIIFSLPSLAAGELKVETETGKIATEVPVVVKSVSRKKLVAKFGDGGPTIHIVSTTGDVDVTQF